MGVGDNGILAVGEDRIQVALDTLQAMFSEEAGVISVYYGAETTEEEVEQLNRKITAAYPDMEVVINPGGQPVYYYILSIE